MHRVKGLGYVRIQVWGLRLRTWESKLSSRSFELHWRKAKPNIPPEQGPETKRGCAFSSLGIADFFGLGGFMGSGHEI